MNPKNLPKTCGKCHPNASANFAVGKVHVEAVPESNLGVYLVTTAYRAIIWGMTILFFGLIGLDLGREGAARDGELARMVRVD